MNNATRTGYWLTTLAAFVWALTSPGLGFLMKNYQIPPLTVALWRDVFIAIACVVALAIVRPGLLRVTRRELGSLALVGAISIGIYHALWIWSITLNGAAVAVVLIYLFPTFVSVGAWLFFREPLRPSQIVALVISLIGCALVVRAYDPTILKVSWLGAAVGLATALTHTVYVLYNQKAVQNSTSPWTSLTYTMLFGSVTLLLLILVLAPQQTFAVGNTATPWLGLLFIALGPTLGGYAIFTLSLRYLPGRIASLIVVLEVPLATLLAVVLLGERLELLQIVGIGLILSSIVVSQLVGLRERQAAVPESATA